MIVGIPVIMTKKMNPQLFSPGFIRLMSQNIGRFYFILYSFKNVSVKVKKCFLIINKFTSEILVLYVH